MTETRKDIRSTETDNQGNQRITFTDGTQVIRWAETWNSKGR